MDTLTKKQKAAFSTFVKIQASIVRNGLTTDKGIKITKALLQLGFSVEEIDTDESLWFC